MTDFIDDKNDNTTHDSLPQWASITQVSRSLGIARSTISDAVKNAWDHHEPWVKKVQGEKNSYYQIDTQHEQYQDHAERWLHQKESEQKREQDAQQDQDPFEDLFVNTSFPWLEDRFFNQGTQFRQWLYHQGIQIFQNLLADANDLCRLWDWRWGQLHGEGYASDELAVIALLQANFDALTSQLKAYENQIEAYETQIEAYKRQIQHLHECVRQAQESKHSWFGKRG